MEKIAAVMLGGTPEEVKYTNNFPKGTDIWAAIDPATLTPDQVGKKVKFYVVQHKTAAEWQADNSLVSVPISASPELILSDDCVSSNAVLVWANPQAAGKYDIVVDFGNNSPDPVNFVSDAQYNASIDLIDDYQKVGFHVTDDPSVPGPYSIGQASYEEEEPANIDAIGVWTQYGAPGDPGLNPLLIGATASGKFDLTLKAEVRYPADTNGTNVPLSAQQTSYPLILVMHGHIQDVPDSYLGFNYLLDHLASHGFIAISIDCSELNAINGHHDTRALAIIEHLKLLQTKNNSPGPLNGKFDFSNIGIMGHSRGGEGVLQAEIFNREDDLGWNIKGVFQLAPTDNSGLGPDKLILQSSKLFCLYGSNDGVTWGGPDSPYTYVGTGFRPFDRATVDKAMAFVYGATHNGFNTVWDTEDTVDTSSPKVISELEHQQLLCGYMTAFMQIRLQNRLEQLDYLSGDLKIPQVSNIEVHAQYQPMNHFKVDDFETSTLVLNSIGGTVSALGLDITQQVDDLLTIDPHSPHQTKGVRLKWNPISAYYKTEIPSGMGDVSGWKFLSFRVCQKVGSSFNPAGQLQDMHVRLTDGVGNSRSVQVSYYSDIPFPYQPEYVPADDASEVPNTKSALKTIRIPLYSWTTQCGEYEAVNLNDVAFIKFEFDVNPNGDIEMDDIEFN